MPGGRYAIRYDVFGKVEWRRCRALLLPCHPAPIQLSDAGRLNAAGSIRRAEFSPSSDNRDFPSADALGDA